MAAKSREFSASNMSEKDTEDEEDCNWNEVQSYCDLSSTQLGLNISRMDSDSCPKIENTSSRESAAKQISAPELEGNQARKMEEAGPSRMSLNDHKAGMEGLDTEKINKIIYEASKGSKFYENELKKEKQVNERIARQNETLESRSEQDKVLAMIEADAIARELENSRDLSRTIVHIDMDAFYAAVEMRDDPSLKDKPMAVGSVGMLSTSNYPARRYGVRAAMPGFIAKKLCPDLVIVPLHFHKYKEVSKVVRGIFFDYDPTFMPMSLDEAYLDLTDCLQERQTCTEKRVFYRAPAHSSNESIAAKEIPSVVDESANSDTTNPNLEDTKEIDTAALECVEFGHDVEEIVREIRFRIENETGLTASAGIACNSMLAKVCTDRNKPNGQFYLKPDRDDVWEFVRSLPIRKVSGIGRVSEQMLKALGITTCEHLYNKRDLLVLLNSDTSARSLIGVSLGLGATRLENDRERKSLSTERTFSEISHPSQLYSACEELSNKIAQDMLEEDLKPKTVTLKLKTVDFEVKSRSHSFANPVTSLEEILTCAKDLLSKAIKACEPKPLRLRLMGVRLSNFQSSSSCSNKSGKQDTIMSFFSKRNSTQEESHQSEKSLDVEPSLPCNSKTEPDWLMPNSSSTMTTTENTVDDAKDAISENTGKHEESSVSDFMAVCPVCNKPQKANGADFLVEFNQHVDLCLNSVAIKEVLSEERQTQGNSQPSTTGGKQTQPSPGKGGKGGKRKQNTKDNSQTKKRTLETFWSK